MVVRELKSIKSDKKGNIAIDTMEIKQIKKITMNKYKVENWKTWKKG
jgi:hypothetical protein